jgi:hypothetical protein
MKSLLVCIALTICLAFVFCGNKYGPASDTTKSQPIAGTPAKDAINKAAVFDLAVNAKDGNGYAMTWTADSVLTVNDSLTAIMGLIKGVKQLQAQDASMREQNQRIGGEAQLAREIFRYINKDGTISDRKKFDELVETYQKLLPK